MTNDGVEYEIFVATLQQAVLAAENVTNLKNLSFERNKKILNDAGVEREFDIYWEYELGGFTYKTVIECKAYNSSVTVERIDALLGKIHGIPDLKPVFATRTGYQSGAIKVARHNKIELLIVREQDDSDWTDQDGTPLIKKASVRLSFFPAAHIHDFIPDLDPQWVAQNTDLDTSKPINLSAMNNELFIEDSDRGETYSLHSLASRLVPPGSEDGRFKKTETFRDAYLVHPKHGRLKLRSYRVDYTTEPPIIQTIEVDFGAALVGVVEYLDKGEKRLVFRDKVVTRRT